MRWLMEWQRNRENMTKTPPPMSNHTIWFKRGVEDRRKEMQQKKKTETIHRQDGGHKTIWDASGQSPHERQGPSLEDTANGMEDSGREVATSERQRRDELFIWQDMNLFRSLWSKSSYAWCQLSFQWCSLRAQMRLQFSRLNSVLIRFSLSSLNATTCSLGVRDRPYLVCCRSAAIRRPPLLATTNWTS